MQSGRLARFIYGFLAAGAEAIILVIGLFAIKSYVEIFYFKTFLFMAASFAVAAAFLFLGSRVNWGNGLSTTWFIILTVVLTLAPRLFWVLSVSTEPDSDFLHLHDYGIAVSQGDFKNYVDFYACFPFKFGFGFLVGGLYSLFGPHHIVVGLFNVFLSLVQVLFVYLIAREIEPASARPAALLYAVWPAQIMYCSVVAAENSFMVPYLAAVYILVLFIKRYPEGAKGYAMLILAGILTAVAQALRPMGMVLVPAAAVCILFLMQRRGRPAADIGRKALCIVLVALAYFISLKLISIPIKNLSGIDITRTGTGYNLLVGTNYKANGMFNQEDFSIIAKYDYDFDTVHSEAKKLAIQRIKEDPVRFLKLAVKKINYQWGKENYGYYFSVLPANGGSSAEQLIKLHPRVFYAISQFHYLVVLLLAVIGCWSAYRKRLFGPSLFWLVIGAMFLAYSFLEVQPRYHLPAVPLFILLAGIGTARLKWMRKGRKQGKLFIKRLI